MLIVGKARRKTNWKGKESILKIFSKIIKKKKRKIFHIKATTLHNIYTNAYIRIRSVLKTEVHNTRASVKLSEAYFYLTTLNNQNNNHNQKSYIYT